MTNNENGQSLADLVRFEINSMPYIKAALGDGVINFSALARKLAPAIEKRLKRKINEETMVVSIKRYADEISKKEIGSSLISHFANSEINLQNNICYAKFRKNERTLSKMERLFEAEDWSIGETRAMIEGAGQISAVLKDTRLAEVKAELKDDMVYYMNNSSLLSVRMPIESFREYGIIAEISSLLAKKGVSIHVMSSPPDIHFIVSEEDAEKAYHTINELIVSSKIRLEDQTKK